MGNFVRAQRDLRGGDVFSQVLRAAGARDGHDVVAFVQKPGKGDLARCSVLLACQLLDSFDQRDVVGEVFTLETRVGAPVIVGAEILDTLDFTGQEAATQRAVGNKADAQFAQCGQNFGLWSAFPQRIFGLERRNGMDDMGTAKGLRSNL